MLWNDTQWGGLYRAGMRFLQLEPFMLTMRLYVYIDQHVSVCLVSCVQVRAICECAVRMRTCACAYTVGLVCVIILDVK